MEKFNDRIYHLLTIGRNDLIQQYVFSFTVCGCYFVYAMLIALVFRSGYSELIAAVMVAGTVSGSFLVFDKYRLVEPVVPTEQELVAKKQENKEPEIVKTEDNLFVESTVEDIEFFTFNDRIQDTFERDDPVELASLLANSNENKIQEVLER